MTSETPSTPRPPAARRLAFGAFELLPDSGELFRDGERIPLQHQPAQLLTLLAERAGEAVSREEIRDEIWGRETYVDHDQSINYCVRQIRQALDDDSAAPRFVETVPRHGYRFVAPVEERSAPVRPDAPPPADGAEPESGPSGDRPSPAKPSTSARWGALAGLVVVGLVVLVVTVLRVYTDFHDPSRERAGVADAASSGGWSGPADQAAGSPPTQVVVPEDAHFNYLKARYLLDRASPAEHVAAATEAIDLLEAVIAEVPRHAEAHAVLADAWMMRFDVPRAEASERAEAAARRALELDPSQPLAHTVLASILFFRDLDWARAGEHTERALELSPDSADALFLSAILHSTLGRHERAIAGARRVATLEPSQLQGLSMAWFYFFARRWDEAVTEAERVLELDPRDEPSHNVLIYTLLARGDEEAADREIARYYGFEPGGETALTAREMFESWYEHRNEEAPGALSPTARATYTVYAGHEDEAIDLLLAACEERVAAWDLPFVAVDPRWDPLRERERFQEVLECVGVPGEESGLRLEEPGV